MGRHDDARKAVDLAVMVREQAVTIAKLRADIEALRAQAARDGDTLAQANEALQKGVVRMKMAAERIQMLEGHMKAKGLLTLDGRSLIQ